MYILMHVECSGFIIAVIISHFYSKLHGVFVVEARKISKGSEVRGKGVTYAGISAPCQP